MFWRRRGIIGVSYDSNVNSCQDARCFVLITKLAAHYYQFGVFTYRQTSNKRHTLPFVLKPTKQAADHFRRLVAGSEWNLRQIKMQISGLISYVYIVMVIMRAFKNIYCVHVTRFDAGPDFSYAPTCTQLLPCVTQSLVVRGKGHCALLAQQKQSDIFTYNETNTECQVCLLSAASSFGSTLAGSQIVYIKGRLKSHKWHYILGFFCCPGTFGCPIS